MGEGYRGEDGGGWRRLTFWFVVETDWRLVWWLSPGMKRFLFLLRARSKGRLAAVSRGNYPAVKSSSIFIEVYARDRRDTYQIPGSRGKSLVHIVKDVFRGCRGGATWACSWIDVESLWRSLCCLRILLPFTEASSSDVNARPRISWDKVTASCSWLLPCNERVSTWASTFVPLYLSFPNDFCRNRRPIRSQDEF